MRLFVLCLQEILSRSTVESHKLDLMAEISSLRLKLAALERERRELDQQYRNAHVRMIFLSASSIVCCLIDWCLFT